MGSNPCDRAHAFTREKSRHGFDARVRASRVFVDFFSFIFWVQNNLVPGVLAGTK